MLQATVARSVCWRAGRSRTPTPAKSLRCSSSSSRNFGGSVLVCEAPSSIAKGRKSSLARISETTGSVSGGEFPGWVEGL